MKITTLIENRVSDSHNNLEAEHGLSLYIEYNKRKILFDTGASDKFYKNAEKLGVDIKEIDTAVISHHHYDHGGGLPFFLSNNSQSKIYLGKRPSGSLFFKAFGGILKKDIGLDNNIFEQHGSRFVFVKEMSEISNGLFLLTDILKKYPRPKGNQKLMVKSNGRLMPDNFEHEIIAVLKEKEELVILTGCAHSGILNMVETVIQKFPNSHIKAVLGGFHLAGIPIENLIPESVDEIESIAEQMLKYPIDKVYTGHCTGMKSYNILKNIMGDKLEYMDSGRSINL